MNLDDGLIKEFKTEREKRGLPPPLLRGDGNGPYDGDMLRRIENLESDMKDVKKDLTDLKVSIAQISGKLDTLTSTLASKLMGPWQMVGVFGGLLGTLIAIAGAVIGLMKWIGVLHISP